MRIVPCTAACHVRAIHSGFTLIELLITLAVAALLYAIAAPAYRSYVVKTQNSQAIVDISSLSAMIERYRSNNGDDLPGTLADLGVTLPKDPWGHSYVYTPLEGIKANPGNARWDKNLKPINIDFDLYSDGADGQTKRKITQSESLDDIIRANGGAYVGVAGDY